MTPNKGRKAQGGKGADEGPKGWMDGIWVDETGSR